MDLTMLIMMSMMMLNGARAAVLCKGTSGTTVYQQLYLCVCKLLHTWLPSVKCVIHKTIQTCNQHMSCSVQWSNRTDNHTLAAQRKKYVTRHLQVRACVFIHWLDCVPFTYRMQVMLQQKLVIGMFPNNVILPISAYTRLGPQAAANISSARSLPQPCQWKSTI